MKARFGQDEVRTVIGERETYMIPDITMKLDEEGNVIESTFELIESYAPGVPVEPKKQRLVSPLNLQKVLPGVGVGSLIWALFMR